MTNKDIVKEIMDFLNPKKERSSSEETKFIEEVHKIIHHSSSSKQALVNLVNRFNISDDCASFLLKMTIREFVLHDGISTEDIFKKLYTSKRGHDAFIKLCAENKLSKLSSIEFIKKYESKIKANPDNLYKLVLKAYPNCGYVANMKLIKRIYFESFKIM